MGVMGGSVLDRPLLHRIGDGICDGYIKAFAVTNRLFHCLIYLGRQAQAHSLIVKNHAAEIIGDASHKQFPSGLCSE